MHWVSLFVLGGILLLIFLKRFGDDLKSAVRAVIASCAMSKGATQMDSFEKKCALFACMPFDFWLRYQGLAIEGAIPARKLRLNNSAFAAGYCACFYGLYLVSVFGKELHWPAFIEHLEAINFPYGGSELRNYFVEGFNSASDAITIMPKASSVDFVKSVLAMPRLFLNPNPNPVEANEFCASMTNSVVKAASDATPSFIF